MILYIDTSDFNKVTFALSESQSSRSEGSKYETTKKSFKIDSYKSHETLGFLDKFLKTHKIKHGEIKKIVVNKGPGSFTGLRVAAALAQALSLAWAVPVKFLTKDKFIIK